MNEYLNEDIIIKNLKVGNEEYFNYIIKAYYDKLYKLIYSIVRDSDMSYDILQDTLLSFYCNIKKFKGNCKLVTWLSRIAINQSYVYLKKNNLYHHLDNNKLVNIVESKSSNPEDETIDKLIK